MKHPILRAGRVCFEQRQCPIVDPDAMEIKLRTLVALIPLDTSECERGFSKMNLIMGPLRTGLSAEHLDWLMRIALLGPDLKDLDPEPIINWWIGAAKRGRQLGKLECHLPKVLASLY